MRWLFLNPLKITIMLKRISYQNKELQEFLDKSKYDILLIEKLIWQVDEKDQCSPYVFGKLIVGFPRVEFGFKPMLPEFQNMDFRQLLNLSKCS